MEGSFNLPSNGNTWKYLETDFHPTVISQIYMFPIVNIDTGSFSIFKYMSTCLLSFGGVDVTGITRLESNGGPDLEKSVQGCNLQRINSSCNTIMSNPHSLADSGLTLKASTPLKELSEQPSSDEEISIDPEEDLDFSVRYPF